MDIRVSPTLLLVGKDKLLLQTRRAVLKTVGFAGILAEKTSEACTASRYLQFQAVLLCHTFDTFEQDQIICELSRSQVDVPMLRLTKNNVDPTDLIGIVQQAVGELPHIPPCPHSAGTTGRNLKQDDRQ